MSNDNDTEVGAVGGAKEKLVSVLVGLVFGGLLLGLVIGFVLLISPKSEGDESVQQLPPVEEPAVPTTDLVGDAGVN